MLVHHYSQTKFNALSPLKFQNSLSAKAKVNELKDQVNDDYLTEVSVFPFSLSGLQILRLQEAGFYRWNGKLLFEYVIDLTKHAELITRVEIVSMPAQNAFFKKNWRKYVKGVPGSKTFTEGKKLYLEAEAKEMLAKGYGPFESVELFERSNGYAEIKGMAAEEWVTLNIKEGNTAQYATSIPHVLMQVTAPLPVTSSSMNLIPSKPEPIFRFSNW